MQFSKPGYSLCITSLKMLATKGMLLSLVTWALPLRSWDQFDSMGVHTRGVKFKHLLMMHPNVCVQFIINYISKCVCAVQLLSFLSNMTFLNELDKHFFFFFKVLHTYQQFFYGMSYSYLHKLCLLFVIAKMLHQTVVASCQFSRTIDWKKIITTSPRRKCNRRDDLLSETWTNELDVKNQVWIDGFKTKQKWQQKNVLCVGKMDFKNKWQQNNVLCVYLH